MDALYDVVVLATCYGCHKSFSKNYPLFIPGYLHNLKHVNGRMIDFPQKFVNEKIIFDECRCHLSLDKYKTCIVEKGFLVLREGEIDPAVNMFGKSKDELIRGRKRIRLSVEWEIEQVENSDYWCEKCKKPFSQPLPGINVEPAKICDGCK